MTKLHGGIKAREIMQRRVRCTLGHFYNTRSFDDVKPELQPEQQYPIPSFPLSFSDSELTVIAAGAQFRRGFIRPQAMGSAHELAS